MFGLDQPSCGGRAIVLANAELGRTSVAAPIRARRSTAARFVRGPSSLSVIALAPTRIASPATVKSVRAPAFHSASPIPS